MAPPNEAFIPCPDCGCHAKAIESECPHCGARLRRRDGTRQLTRAAALAGLSAAAFLGVACGDDVETTTGDSTTTTGDSTTTSTSSGMGGDVNVGGAYGVGPSVGGFGGDMSVGGAYGGGPSVGGSGGESAGGGGAGGT